MSRLVSGSVPTTVALVKDGHMIDFTHEMLLDLSSFHDINALAAFIFGNFRKSSLALHHIELTPPGAILQGLVVNVITDISKSDHIYVHVVDAPFLVPLPNLTSQAAQNGKVVQISGAIGSAASHINGLFDRTENLSCGLPVYQNRDSDNYFLEYLEHPSKRWQITSGGNRGKNSSIANVRCKNSILPWDTSGQWYELLEGEWMKNEGKLFILSS